MPQILDKFRFILYNFWQPEKSASQKEELKFCFHFFIFDNTKNNSLEDWLLNNEWKIEQFALSELKEYVWTARKKEESYSGNLTKFS